MVPDLEKPRVTEIHVRMDCNGCVQKIKRALYGINGIYDLYIDFPQQKLTIVGWADPEKIVKAIKKTRRTATICSHTEPSDQPAQSSEQAPEGSQPPPEAAPANPPPPQEAPPAEPGLPAEPPKEPPPPPESPPPPEKPQPDSNPCPSPYHTEIKVQDPSQETQPGPKDVGDVHVINHHLPNYSYRYGYQHNHVDRWSKYTSGNGIQHEPPPQPVNVTHSYSKYKPSPYVTEYEYVRSPPTYTFHNRMDSYRPEEYHHHYNNYNSSTSSGNGNITSIFSDENPNACRVM